MCRSNHKSEIRNYKSAFTLAVALVAGFLAQPAWSADPGDFLNLVKIDDGSPATCEFGYVGDGVNSIANIAWNLRTVGDQQFVTYYYRNPNSHSDPNNDKVLIARRTHGQPTWDILKTNLTATDISDNHDNINMGIDGDGYMHLSWGMHVHPLRYAKSSSSVVGANPLTMSGNLGTAGMTGQENDVTYPQFFNLPDGDLLFLYREGGCWAGGSYLNRYNADTDVWGNVHKSGASQSSLLRGMGFTPDWNSYPNRMVVDNQGRLHLTWTNRYQTDSPAGESGYQTNHNFYYARSTDQGRTWTRMDGTPYTLPIIGEAAAGANPASVGELVVPIPEGSSLINSADMTVDKNGNPVIASWWAPGAQQGNHRRQYMVAFHDDAEYGDVWQTRQVSNRTIDSPSGKKGEDCVRDLARPIVLCDDDNRLLVVYRDNQDSNGITVAYSEPYSVDPTRSTWTTIDLTTDNMGKYEPNYDLVVWATENKLHLLYQAQAGCGNGFPSGNASPVSVLEWDARAYFASVPEPSACALAATGLTCLGLYTWRKGKQKKGRRWGSGLTANPTWNGGRWMCRGRRIRH